MSHVIHENVEEYRTEDLNPLVSCLLPHSAFLRYIFLILPLFIVLVSETSSDLTEIRNDYENLLVNIINQLDELISQNITSSCDVNRPCRNRPCRNGHCNICKNASITEVTLCLKKNYTNIYPDLKKHMNTVSELTTKVLDKNGNTLQPCDHRPCYHQCRKIIPLSSRKSLCCLQNVASGLRNWWRKFLYSDFKPECIK